MQIDWWTLALQVINFLVLVWLLWRFLFRPVRNILARRREEAAKASGELEDAKKEALEEKRRFEKARAELAGERRELITKVHKEMAEERTKTLEEAEEEAAEIIRSARESIAEERQAALASLRDDIAELAADMAAHLLEKVSPETYNTLLLEEVIRRVENLSDEERRQLDSDLAAEGAVIAVTTAQPLDDESRKDWDRKLHKLLNTSANVEFETKPDLIAGAELRLPHVAVMFSWADELQESKKAMSEA